MAINWKGLYSMDIWRSFPTLLPHIITEELEISFLDEIDSFSLQYKVIIHEHKSSKMNIIRYSKLITKNAGLCLTFFVPYRPF